MALTAAHISKNRRKVKVSRMTTHIFLISKSQIHLIVVRVHEESEARILRKISDYGVSDPVVCNLTETAAKSHLSNNSSSKSMDQHNRYNKQTSQIHSDN